jgi:hypothetical protein
VFDSGFQLILIHLESMNFCQNWNVANIYGCWWAACVGNCQAVIRFKSFLYYQKNKYNLILNLHSYAIDRDILQDKSFRLYRKRQKKITIFGQHSAQQFWRINLAANNSHHVDKYLVNGVNLLKNCLTNYILIDFAKLTCCIILAK